MKILWAALARLALLGASDAPRVDDLAWMSGQWASESEGRWSEEEWTVPRGGVMLGHSRSGRGEGLREFEFLRLQAGPDGVPVYLAQPGGKPPVAFRLVAHTATSATFENAEHDYPQRIIYVRDGDSLTATISTIDGSKPVRWTLQRR